MSGTSVPSESKINVSVLDVKSYRAGLSIFDAGSDNGLFLNFAATAPVARPVLEKMKQAVEEMRRPLGDHLYQALNNLEFARRDVAEFIGAQPKEIAFTQNTSTAMSTIALSIDWKAGDRVLVGGNEFPSNFYPWTNLKHRRVEHAVFHPQANVPIIETLKQMDLKNVKAISLRAVSFETGRLYELKELANEAFDLELDKNKTYSLEQLTKLIKGKVKFDLALNRGKEQQKLRKIGSKEGFGLSLRKKIIGKKLKYGRGLGDNKTLSITKPPKFKDFGYYNINYPRLIDKNVFNILYKSGSNHHSFPPIKISDEYRDFLKELIDKCRINDDKLSKLNEPESIHFNNVLIASGLSNKFKPKANNSDKVKEENNRFNILLGEIKAGNDNKEIIKELKSLIKKFMNDGRLNKNEAQQALNEIALSLM